MTPVGIIEAKWTKIGLYSCSFTKDENETVSLQDAASSPDNRVADFATRLNQFFENGDFDLAGLEFDWSGTSDFSRLALLACARIPAGQTKTYGNLARSIGHPSAARAIGRAMATNRWPLAIPCHRVLSSTGKLTGYSGTGGINTKKWLLELEQTSLFAASDASASVC